MFRYSSKRAKFQINSTINSVGWLSGEWMKFAQCLRFIYGFVTSNDVRTAGLHSRWFVYIYNKFFFSSVCCFDFILGFSAFDCYFKLDCDTNNEMSLRKEETCACKNRFCSFSSFSSFFGLYFLFSFLVPFFFLSF